MKKVFYAFLGILLLLFVVFMLRKTEPPEEDIKRGTTEKTFAEKERIQQFWAIYRRATDHRIAGRLKSAARDYREALSLNDKHEDAHYYLGNVYLALGEFKSAEKTWKRLVYLNPNSARAHFQLGDLYLRFDQKQFFDIDAAEAEFQRTLEINKEETAPLLRVGQVALIQGRLSDAQRFFDAVIGSNYRSVEAHFLNGFIAWQKGDRQKASAFFGKAVQYSRPVETALGIPGEGDTRRGEDSLWISKHSDHQTIFHEKIGDLSGLGQENIVHEMELRYEELRLFLNQLRRRVKS
jgi:tetratricopeptide (TPR) repeat protein